MIYNEFQSKQFLKECGINIPEGKICSNMSEVFEIWNKINADKLVFKIVSKDIIHKSDVGGVKTNIPTRNTKKGMSYEFDSMISHIKTKFPEAKIDGIYIQEMIESGIECIIGIKEDPQFGKVIIFGLGGIYAEVFKDISMRVLPITKDDAKEMISETKVFKILSGARGKIYYIEGIIDTIMKISKLAEEKNIIELDINPLVVREKDVIALDCRVMR
jgi:acyl-CoA synthetase (NDP forming)